MVVTSKNALFARRTILTQDFDDLVGSCTYIARIRDPCGGISSCFRERWSACYHRWATASLRLNNRPPNPFVERWKKKQSSFSIEPGEFLIRDTGAKMNAFGHPVQRRTHHHQVRAATSKPLPDFKIDIQNTWAIFVPGVATDMQNVSLAVRRSCFSAGFWRSAARGSLRIRMNTLRRREILRKRQFEYRLKSQINTGYVVLASPA